MDRFEFQRDVTVEGVPYAAGDQITADQIPAGHLASCLRVGHLKKLPPPAPRKAGEPADAPAEQPVEDAATGDETADDAPPAEPAQAEVPSEPKPNKRRR